MLVASGTHASDVFTVLGTLVGVVVLFALYWLPTWVAIHRRVPNMGSTVIVNALLGWTFVGWVVALAMALRDQRTVAG